MWISANRDRETVAFGAYFSRAQLFNFEIETEKPTLKLNEGLVEP